MRYADGRTKAGQKVGSDLRPEAVQYLGVSFAEPDWDGDAMPDPVNGLERAQGVLQGARERAPRPRGVPAPRRHLLRPDQVRGRDRGLQGAAAEVAVLLRRARVQDRIVHAYEKDRNLVAAAKEREALGRGVRQGERLVRAQQGQPRGARGGAHSSPRMPS